ncbi:hypothetical protein [Streptomyces sp. Amel2xC10]|uniref:hypothetical protein n=1 Tax=Streptomyces sp. Amel2xC10 TaxID=1305826 RepID=UPI00117ED5FD|nr:hypothetical protein [Streptomyces sp. Amel2xC10]
MADDLRAELARAKWVTVLTSRGNDLQRDVFAGTLRAGSEGTKRVRILLPDPDAVGPPDWIDVREAEAVTFDHAYQGGMLRLHIRQNISYVAAHIASGRIEMRLYNQPHVARIVLTDRVAYLTRYEDIRHGQLSPVKKYRRGDMYDYLCRSVALTWDHARRPAGTP